MEEKKEILNETEEMLKEKEKKERRKRRLTKWRRNLFWILFVFIGVYVFLDSLVYYPWDLMMEAIADEISNDVFYIMEYYTSTITSVLLMFLLTWLIRPNRYVWKSFLLPKSKRHAAAKTDENDTLAEYYGRNRNGFKMLGLGLLLGFIMNFISILCALIHGDIKLYFESSFSQIPLFLFALVSVLIQSSSEEMWCRGFLYERLHEHYPLWVAILANGVLFGLLHVFNDGATVLSIIEIAVCGFSFSLVRWYTGSIWVAMGLHTGWNFTQAFLFGLPNSGLVSGLSLFHLDASTGVSNLVYDFEFGVEGGLPAMIIDILLGLIVILLAAKSGRLKELTMSREKTLGIAKVNVGA